MHKGKLRAAAAGFAVLLGLWVLTPLLWGEWNEGFVAAPLFWAAAVVAGRPRFWQRLRERYGRCALVLEWLVAGACAVVLLILLVLAGGALSHRADRESTVLVLGCRVEGTRPSPMLRRRCEAAADYLLQHPDAVAIATGGPGPRADITEAECIRRTLVLLGVEDHRIFVEPNAASTRENMQYSAAIIEQNGLSRSVAVASDGFHQFRARVFAGRAGLTASPLNCKNGLGTLCYWCREVGAVVKMWITGN